MYGKGASLASTGVGIMFLGQHVEMGWLIGGAIGVIVVGCLAFRLATRSKRIVVSD